MASLRETLARLSGSLRRRTLDAEMDEEMRFHVEMQTAKNVRQGMTPDDARRAAMIAFGGAERMKEAARDETRERWLEDGLQDVRYAFRLLRRTPGFTFVAVASLALGIGANTTVFSVVNAVLLKPLPYPEPERLMSIGVQDDERTHSSLSVADLEELEARGRSFTAIGAYQRAPGGITLVGSGGAEQVAGTWITAGVIPAMGVAPALGRAALSNEDDEGAPGVVVLSHAFWSERFGASPAALGQSLMLDGEPFAIVGVMPEGFTLPAMPDDRIWPVLQLAKPEYRAPFWLRTFARLAPGVTPERARVELAQLTAAVKARYPDSPPQWAFSLVDVRTQLVKDVRTTVLILYAAVALILLMAAANASSLFLTRASARMPELAIRSALGAGRRRIVRQLVTESTIVGVLGGIVGVLLAVAGVKLLVGAAPAGVPRLEEVRIDWIVLLVTAGLSIVIGFLVGLVPALMVPRQALDAGIREGGRGAGISGTRHRVRDALVIGEFALALTVIVAAALVTDSLMRLQRVDPGMRPEGLLATRLAIPAARYPEPANVEAFFDDVLRRVKALPGVTNAALSMAVPPNRLVMRNPYTPEGKVFATGESAPVAQHILVSPEYFSTLGIPFARGRPFTDADRDGSPLVAIINETFARRAFPGQEPVGRWFQMGDPHPDSPKIEIVGVVPDVKYAGLDAEDVPTFYVPFRQSLWWRNMYVVLRTDGDPARHAPAIRAAVAAVDPQVGLLETRTVEGLMSESVAVPRYRALLLGAFALLALILASAGIYAVMSYSVTQRTRETGVRLALGATPRAVLVLVVTDGLRLAAIGVVIGVCLAMATTRWLSSLLYEVSPLNPVSFVGTAVFLALVAVFACALPAWRASRTDPMRAIRVE